MKVFIIPFHVKSMENSIMPAGSAGAYVSCYCSSETYVEATKTALKQLTDDGLYPEEVLQPIHQMTLAGWTVHINETWPDYVDSLPAQADFEASMRAGEVVYGPFGAYNPQ